MSAKSEVRAVSQHVVVDGERIHTMYAAGEGTPLVICNDFVADASVLDGFVRALAGRPVLCFDPPGIGLSDDVNRWRRMPALARLLAELIDRVGLGPSVDVMGIGWGGMLAQQFARDHRNRVRRQVLAATSSGQLMFPGRIASLFRLARPNGLATVAPDAARARTIFGGRREDECRPVVEALARARPATRRGYGAQLYALTGYSSLTWLHRLNVPTLVLAGDDDAIVPMVNARMMALLLPQARLAIIRGGGHWFVLERTDEVVRLLADFLDSKFAITAADEDSTF